MLGKYLLVLEEKSDQLENKIISLKKSDEESLCQTLREIMQELHTIKGTSGSYELHFVSNVCHHCEDHVLEIADKQMIDKSDEEKLLEFIDLIRDYVHKEQDDGTVDQGPFENDLRRFFKTKKISSISWS